MLGYTAHRSIEQCRSELTVTYYRTETELTDSVRIVHLTDLHSHVFGNNNTLLVETVLQQKPDLVLSMPEEIGVDMLPIN